MSRSARRAVRGSRELEVRLTCTSNVLHVAASRYDERAWMKGLVTSWHEAHLSGGAPRC
jgi:hypothetical protein